MQSVPIEQIEAESAERRIERIYALPAPPPVVQELLGMQAETLPSGQLDKLLDTRPNLRDQLTACMRLLEDFTEEESREGARYMMAPDDRYRITLALATARSFVYVCNGPLGAHAFWHHALSNAVLSFRMAQRGLHRGTAFTAGLLHNIGFMVIARLFPPEFKMLNRLFARHPELPVTVLEGCVLGMGQAQELLSMGHAQTGSWLLREWGMPRELSIVAREHHNAEYRGGAEKYCGIVATANHLLAAHGIGDAAPDPLETNELPERNMADPQTVDIAEKLASVPENLASTVRELITHSNG